MSIFAWLLPLAMGVLYAFASLVLKQAIIKGAGPMRIIFLTNWILFFLWIPFSWHSVDWSFSNSWWLPCIGGLLRVGGGAFLMAALRLGDVSVQTPMAGIKVIFVALFAYVSGAEVITPLHGLAAILTMGSIYLLGKSQMHSIDRKRFIQGIGCSCLSAVFFAINDVLAARVGHRVNVSHYLFFNFLSSALGSLCFIPFFKAPLKALPHTALRWAIAGSFLLAVDIMGLLWAISTYQEATTVNILYASRGIWSIIMVWSIGRYFSHQESQLGHAVMLKRLVGASLLFIAIVLVMLH